MVAVNSAGMTNLGKQGVITQRASSQSSSAQITTPVAGVATNAAAQSGSLPAVQLTRHFSPEVCLPGRVGSSPGWEPRRIPWLGSKRAATAWGLGFQMKLKPLRYGPTRGR